MIKERATGVLAGYIVEENFDRLPQDVVQRAKDCVQDAVGCVLAAQAIPFSTILRKFADDRGGRPESHILGTGLQTACTTAAFSNAVLMNALDYDDIYRKGHLGATAVPASFAVGEAAGCSGRDLLTALVVGYEVSGRVGASLRHLHPRKTIHGHGTWQTFGAAAAAARVLGLDGKRAAQALAVAGANAPVASVMKTVYGAGAPTMAKNNFGPAAEAGVTAALLAKNGFEGPLDIFEGDSGFWKMFGADEYDADAICQGLGTEYEIRHVGFKPYSCCRILQSSIEAAVQACHRKKPVNPADIEKIVLEVVPILCKPPFSNARPTTMWAAQFSAPYVVAMALMSVAPGPDWFAETTFEDPDVLALMDRIELRALAQAETQGPGKDRISASATVHTRRGDTHVAHVDVATGEAANALSRDALDEKFIRLARYRMTEGQAHDLHGQIQDLENAPSLEPLVQAMAPCSGACPIAASPHRWHR